LEIFFTPVPSFYVKKMQLIFFSSFEALHIFRMCFFKGKKKGKSDAKKFEKFQLCVHIPLLVASAYPLGVRRDMNIQPPRWVVNTQGAGSEPLFT
jgi:hypothetical protein